MSNQLKQKKQQISQQEWENLDSNEQAIVDISDSDAKSISGGGDGKAAIGAYFGSKVGGSTGAAAGAYFGKKM